MGVLSLRVRLPERGIMKTMQFDPQTVVYDACKIIREKLPDATAGQNPKDFGLFLSDEDPRKGVWMENGRTLEYYLVRNQDLLEYKKKIRTLKVRMLDGAVKTLLVDDSKPVGEMMIAICSRIGIANYEEYSMTRETADKENTSGTMGRDSSRAGSSDAKGLGTLTLDRSKKDKKKMEALRHKLHTDEELNWVDHSRTLREQGIDEAETLLLRRKFFFSDTNVDSRDPVQLNLLYSQCRDGTIIGSHPVTRETAYDLAALQCQVQFGEFQETRTKTGILDLREFLPKEYVKLKNAEKDILAIYRTLRDMSEADAKVKYVHLCRSLKTYGVTFFVVKEKVKGKNKLVPRLLGINKESVMRVDEKTKDIIKEWPLEQVRRWAASPNTFTLDFGDYQDAYYSVQTEDGEKIAQLIAGYIDIILKKKKAKDHLGIEGDEGSTMLEDTVSPAKATLMSHGQITAAHGQDGHIALPGIMRPAVNGEYPYSSGSLQRAQYGAVGGQVVSAHPPPGRQPEVIDPRQHAQRALIGTIEESVKMVERAEEDLQRADERPILPPKEAERELEVKKESVEDQLAAMGAATAQVVQLTGEVPDRVDHTAVGAAISTIGSNIPEMTKGVKTIAALMEEDDRGDELLAATRKLCNALGDFLNAVNPHHDEHSEDDIPRSETRQTVLAAASRVGEFSHAMIQTMEEPTDESKEFQDILVQLARSVATSTAQLVLKAKTISSECQDEQQKDRIVHSATQCAFATSQLVACARVVAPTIDSPACQEQLTGAAKQVMKAVENLLANSEVACTNKKSLGDLHEAAAQVTTSLNELLAHIKTGPRLQITTQDQELETIITSTDRLISYQGSSSDMVRQAKVLAEATTHLVSQIKGDAESKEDKDKLLGAARKVADATSKMIDAAKECAVQPHTAEHQIRLKAAAEDLRTATSEATADQLRRRAMQRLEAAARNTVASATQTIAAANAAEASNTNEVSQRQLTVECQSTANLMPVMISALRISQQSANTQREVVAHSELIHVCHRSLEPCGRLVNASRLATSTVGHEATAMQLNNSTLQLSESLAELRASITKLQETSSTSGLEYAIQVAHGLQEDLGEYRRNAQNLPPAQGETVEGGLAQLNSSTRVIGSAMAQLLSAAGRNDEQFIETSAHDAADGLRQLTSGVHAVCASQRGSPGNERLIDGGSSVVVISLRLFQEVRQCLSQPDDPTNRDRLSHVAQELTASLKECLTCLPGQRDIDVAIQSIETLTRTITVQQITTSTRSYQEVQDDLLKTASELSRATNRLVADSSASPAVLKESVNNYVRVYTRFHSIVLEMIYHQQDPGVQQDMIECLRNLALESTRLLHTVKQSNADPTASHLKQQMTANARSVTESINHLVDICLNEAPWQRECDNALRNIQTMKHLLDNPDQPVNALSYFDCLDLVTGRSKNLGDAMTNIAHYAKETDMQSFCRSVRDVSDAVCGLAEGTAQAAYLVGVSDAHSQPGVAGLLDATRFGRSAQLTRDACQRLISRQYSQKAVLDDATSIAKHTSQLANMCREASARTTNSAAKRHFINCARDVASSTAALITAVKTLDGDFNDANKTECARAASDLLQPLDSLATFVNSPEFAGVPAKISHQGRQAQQPIVNSGRSMLDSSCEMIGTAKQLAVAPKDPAVWQRLAGNSRLVSDSIKQLVSAIREKAPGQADCDAAIERMNGLIRDIDQASMAAINQSLQPRSGNTEKGYQSQIITSVIQIQERLEAVRHSAKKEAETLGHKVRDEMLAFEPLVNGSIGAASMNTYNSRQQQQLLDQSKTVAECQLQLLYAAKDAGGNPRATDFHLTVDEAADALRDALGDLQHSAQAAASDAGVVSSMVESISRSIALSDERVSDEKASQTTFVDCQTRMVMCCKQIAKIAQDMVSCSYSDTSQLGALALELSKQYAQLCEDTRYAVALSPSADVGRRIRSAVQELGTACIELVKQAGACRTSPDDQIAKRDLADAARLSNEKVALLLSALHSGSRGTQACINAASTVSGIIGDLDTTIMFATAGSLNPDTSVSVSGAPDHFSDHRESILKTAKALVEDTKALVSGAASSQEQLAVAAQNAVRTIVQLSDVVKSGAAALTSVNSESQVLVINAVKDVASALSNLIQTTKSASGRSFEDPAMSNLKEAAKVMVTSVTSLLKTVKTVEDKQQRGTRALEAAIEAIALEIRAYDSSERPSTRSVKPESLMAVSRPVTDATAKTVAAGSSLQQDDVIVAANLGRSAVAELLHTTKAAAFTADSPDTRYRVLDAGRDVAIKVRELLQQLHTVLNKPTQENKEVLIPASRSISQAVTDLIGFGEILKGLDYIDPADPTVIAENELLGAANSIEAAAKKLATLRPRQAAKTEKNSYKGLAGASLADPADESLNFDEQILEAAKSIAAAVQALVKAASSAQRELVAQGRIDARPAAQSEDYQWSDGLISAARMVAAAVHSLCEAANALVQGMASEEKLISAAKQVAASTAQLLVACKVKADMNSKSMHRLQTAGHAVKTATEHLVRAAKQSIEAEDERTLIISQRMVSGIAQVMDAQEIVLRKERELQEARVTLSKIRKAKYEQRPAGSHENSPDGPYFSDY